MLLKDEESTHVHIHCADGGAKYWLEPTIELAINYRLSAHQLARIIDVEQASPGHLRRPELDIELAVDSIENPDNFPLQAR